MGVNEGDIISLEGVSNRSYRYVTVDVRNQNLFKKDGDSLYLVLDFFKEFNVVPYEVQYGGGSKLALRKYFMHHS